MKYVRVGMHKTQPMYDSQRPTFGSCPFTSDSRESKSGVRLGSKCFTNSHFTNLIHRHFYLNDEK